MKYYLKIVVLTLLQILPAGASEEIPTPFNSFTAQVGTASISIEAHELGRISEIRIKAFGRVMTLGQKELRKFADFRFSQVRVTRGASEEGGQTMQFLLSHKGFFGGDPFEGDPAFEETLRISVSEKLPPSLSVSRKRTIFN